MLNFVTLRLILVKICVFIRTEIPKNQFLTLLMIKIWIYLSIIKGIATFMLNFMILSEDQRVYKNRNTENQFLLFLMSKFWCTLAL